MEELPLEKQLINDYENGIIALKGIFLQSSYLDSLQITQTVSMYLFSL